MMKKYFYLIFAIVFNIVFSLHGMALKTSDSSEQNVQTIVDMYRIEEEIKALERLGGYSREMLLLQRYNVLREIDDLAQKISSAHDMQELAEFGRRRRDLSKELLFLERQIKQEYFELQVKLERMLPVELREEYLLFKSSRDSMKVEKRTNVWFFLTERSRYENSAIYKLSQIAYVNREAYKILYGRYPIDSRTLKVCMQKLLQDISKPLDQVIPCAKCKIVPDYFDATVDMPLLSSCDSEKLKKGQPKKTSKHKEKKKKKEKHKQHVRQPQKAELVQQQPKEEIKLDPVERAAELINKIKDLKNPINYLHPLLNELEDFAQKGVFMAREFLGVFYSENHEYSDGGIMRDVKKAIYFLSVCIDENPTLMKPESIFILGMLCSENSECIDKALHFISLSLKQGYKPQEKLIKYLADLYFKAKNFSEAIHWIEQVGNEQLIWWYKGRHALESDEMSKAIEFFEHVFPLCQNAKYLPKKDLTDFDFVVQSLLKQIDNPNVNALLIRMDLTEGIEHSKFTRQYLIQKLTQVSAIRDNLSAIFILAYLYTHGIEVEKSTQRVNILLGWLFLSTPLNGAEFPMLESRPDLIELLEIVTKPISDNFVRAFLHENSECDVNPDRDTLFKITVCHILSCFFATHGQSGKAALNFMAAEHYVTRICKSSSSGDHEINRWNGILRAYDNLLNLAQKQRDIHAIAALSFSVSSRLLNKIKMIVDGSERLIPYFFDMISQYIEVHKKTGINKNDEVLSVACNLAGNYFYTLKQDIPSALKCLRFALKFSPNSELIMYNLGSAIVTDNPEKSKEGKDLLLKICDRSADAAFLLGCFYDPKNDLVGGKIAQKSKDICMALEYYERAANRGNKHAAFRMVFYLLEKANFTLEDKKRIEKYLEVAGDEFRQEEKLRIYWMIARKVKLANLIPGAQVALQLLDDAAINKQTNKPIESCKLLTKFIDMLDENLSLGCVNNLSLLFFYLISDLNDITSPSSQIDQNTIRVVNLFLKRIDDRLLSEQFFKKIQDIGISDKPYEKSLVEQLLFVCQRRSNLVYMGKLLSYHLMRFGDKDDKIFKHYLEVFRENIASDDNLTEMYVKIVAQINIL